MRVVPILRGLVTLALIGAVFAVLDIDALGAALSRITWPAIALGFCLLVGQTVVVGIRSFLILRAQGSDISATIAMKSFLVGTIANAALPNLIGGIIARLLFMRSYGVSLATGAVSLLAEKLLILASLTLAALFGLAVVTPPSEAIIWYVLLAFPSGLALLIGAVFVTKTIAKALPLPARLVVFVSRSGDELLRLAKAKGHLLAAFTISFFGLILLFMAYYALCNSFDRAPHWSVLMAVLPIVTFFSSLPLSIGGWGVREASFAVFLGGFGLPIEYSVAVALMIGALSLFAAVVVLLVTYTIGLQRGKG